MTFVKMSLIAKIRWMVFFIPTLVTVLLLTGLAACGWGWKEARRVWREFM